MDNNNLALLGPIPEGNLTQDMLLEHAKNMLDSMLDFKELLLGYNCAIKEIKTKFDVLNTEFEVRYRRNPISSIHTRLKSQTSIMEKLGRLGLEMTRDNIEQNLHDIAGIRVICSYVDDIYSIADAFIRPRFRFEQSLWISGRVLSTRLSISRTSGTRRISPSSYANAQR